MNFLPEPPNAGKGQRSRSMVIQPEPVHRPMLACPKNVRVKASVHRKCESSKGVNENGII